MWHLIHVSQLLEKLPGKEKWVIDFTNGHRAAFLGLFDLELPAPYCFQIARDIGKGQQASVTKGTQDSNQWNSERRFRATYPPTGCRTFGKPPLGPCHSDEPHYHHINNGFHTTHAENSPVRPRIVTVVRPGGRRHMRKITILLNRRSVQTFEQLVADISETLGYPRWKNDRIRKLFNLKGKEIRGVSDFFRSDEVFVASGRDKLSLQDITEVLEELYPDRSHYHSVVLQTWERVLGQAVNASKADSGFHEELEPVQSLVPPAADGPQRTRGKVCQEERQRGKQCEKDRREGQRSEKTQMKRAKDGFPLKDKIDKINAVYAPCVSYCKNCKKGRGGRERGDLIKGKVESPARDGQVVEKDRSLEMGAAPQRFSHGDHERPWENEEMAAGIKEQNQPEEGAAERQEPTENRKTERSEKDHNDLPVGPMITRSEIEQHYDIGRVIGDGNFAVVKECRLRDTVVPYAMKIIDKEKLKGKEHMIMNEISIIRSIVHPHVVRLLRDYETEDQIYLLMEFVHGGDLFDALTENVKFPEHHASLMVKDLCDALTYIHGKNIVHRDLKPENLLVQRNPDGSRTLKLADFGLAMVVTEPIFTVCGTPTYVAPEILSEKGYGLPVDMWATGVILYILLSGFPPFRSQEKDQDELFELIQQGEYEFLPPYWDHISDGAKGLIRGLLLVDPGARLTAEQALHHPWVQNGVEEGNLPDGAETVNATRFPPISPSTQFRASKPQNSNAVEIKNQ
ncbi:hypothetical protein AAFF_G00242680 [Aldrovandia affinis]|uniref:non-specific serine/threonine protein kinase n=1 Tax=Aldrovandia affinis TaxID=143900 RepID=A0AAD7REE9_9TELE|nr:hypothetical protein AAFF_G00242680 [Aldrovandia affinis]